MKAYCPVFLIAVCFVFASSVPADSAKGREFSESVLTSALEHGCSLVVAKALSIRAQSFLGRGDVYYYKVEVSEPIVPSDLTRDDMRGPIELFAGTSYGSALKQGSTYALFVTKDCPYHFSWVYRDDVIEVDAADKERLRSLERLATTAYANTSIRKFRESKLRTEVVLPRLPDAITALCEDFRDNLIDRATVAERIFQSDIGSRLDESKPESSIRRYLPPKISLSRAQVLSLLGRPTLKVGWTYKWYCGADKNAPDEEQKVGALSVTFDEGEQATLVLYSLQERAKWAKYYVERKRRKSPLSDEARAVMLKFQEALRGSEWERALSYCSKKVKQNAKQYESVEAFFEAVVPVEKLLEMSQFPVWKKTVSKGNRTTLFGSFVQLSEPGAQPTINWEWDIKLADAEWVIDFKKMSLDKWVEKETLRLGREAERYQARVEELTKGLETKLIPLSKEFVIGQPMLFRLEVTNVSESPITYMPTSSVMLNDPMIIKGPDGGLIRYVDTDYQTAARDEQIMPGKTLVVSDGYDATSQYGIVEPGRYSFQFRGMFEKYGSSNTVEVDVKPGKLAPADEIVKRLVSVLPEGWEFTRRIRQRKAAAERQSNRDISVHLIGRGRYKGKDAGICIFIRILPEADIMRSEPGKSGAWGQSKWGAVYVQRVDAELLWPDYRKQIIKALGIEEI
ncbi:MAG: hypothetical protein ACYS21_01130 [Planctomycetota bacterium]|jgi:hypothetical protein